MKKTIENIYDLDPIETLQSTQRSLYGLSELLFEQSHENMAPEGLHNLGEIIKTLTDLQVQAISELKQKTHL